MAAMKLTSGFMMPSIAFGLGTYWYKPSPEKAVELGKALRLGLDVGYRHIDNAEMYQNEEFVGPVINQWLQEHPEVPREDLFIVSKVDQASRDPAKLHAAFEKTLSSLQLKYLDLYLIHSPFEAPAPLPIIWKEMEKLVDDGLVKSIGVSNFRVSDLKEILEGAKHRPVCNQVELHPHVLDPELEEFCKKENIILTSYGGLGPVRSAKGNDSFRSLLDSLASKHSCEPPSILQSWLLKKEFGMITTSSKKERLENMLFGVAKIELTDEEVQQITEEGAKFYCRVFWGERFPTK
eukprot:CAMPEP_0201504688 /NCGR_PEP_ID=MMETSP0151_2-20130828/85348_1 /ASSEMBLY_ACC=CAM_ASM_000257 /TAXON_ID=200890 /ORGANISM="Paramoeba atlantica, Strain 621/1 / CCAP 1560/9" /LENGTH=292 /DNA_ID=CAMNT_0047898461 /DNA_START=22 /DNA_END=900 /DNA_ORIENTATION=+